MHALFCAYNTELFDETDSMIEDILEILPSEKPGNRIRYDLSSRQEQPGNEEELISLEAGQEESETADLDPAVEEGLKIMYELDFNALRKKYDKKSVFSILSDSDKVLLSYLLFLEFENEYSFILTTNRIKFKSEYTGSRMEDYKTVIQELYNSMRKPRQAFTLYHEAFIDYNKMRNEKPITSDQYINYSKRVDEFTKKKDLAGSNAKGAIKSFMEKTARELDVLVKDMDYRQMYIANPQDEIEMNPEIEGEKKLHGLKIYEGIQIVRNYAAAFAYRLNPEGDLYGKQEYSENSSSVVSDDNIESTGKQSILDELDDII